MYVCMHVYEGYIVTGIDRSSSWKTYFNVYVRYYILYNGVRKMLLIENDLKGKKGKERKRKSENEEEETKERIFVW